MDVWLITGGKVECFNIDIWCRIELYVKCMGRVILGKMHNIYTEKLSKKLLIQVVAESILFRPENDYWCFCSC